MGHSLGFVGTRFAGTDGVSLESFKWAQILEDHHHHTYWFAGEIERRPETSMLVPEAHFTHPNIRRIYEAAFGEITRSRELTRRIYKIADDLKEKLYEFTDRFEIEILIVENALSIPMNIPLGVALTHFIAETGTPAIAHHHDFHWERRRFAVTSVGDILEMSFPPHLPSIQHVTINTVAQQAVSSRQGASTVLVPNVLDFAHPPQEGNHRATDFRVAVGLEPEDVMFLQPTRVVPRKGIEHSISLVSRLKNPRCKLIISHHSGDEGHDYERALIDKAEHEGVDLRFAHPKVRNHRSAGSAEAETFTLEDAYAASDFVTYPSQYEGFGNALLEAFYFRKPVLVNRYASFITDIEPKGFRVVAMDGYLTREVVAEVERLITDERHRADMIEHNFQLGKAFFSYEVLRRMLRVLITNFTGLDHL
jgi:glycosyltransferase involved in cell wall biosynthesis